MYRYAQISNGICFSISSLSGEVIADDMILLTEWQDVQLGDFYTDGVWTKAPQPESEPIPEINLEELKASRYKQAAENLQAFLRDNPLKSSCHGGKEALYDVTADIQSKLANSFSTHVMLTQQGIEDTFTWFDIEDFCEAWTDGEVLTLMKEMKDYVTEKESLLQHMRVQINNAITVEEVNAVNIEFEVTESEEIT